MPKRTKAESRSLSTSSIFSDRSFVLGRFIYVEFVKIEHQTNIYDKDERLTKLFHEWSMK